MKKQLSRGLVVLAAAGAFVLPSSPANAMADAGFDAGMGGTLPYQVAGTCEFVGVVVSGQLRVVWAGEATASGPSPAVATRITCTLRQMGDDVAGSSTALPEPAAVTAGTDTIPFKSTRICAAAFALFLDGTTAEFDNC